MSDGFDVPTEISDVTIVGPLPLPVTGTIVTSPDVNIHDSAGNTLTSTGTSLDTNITNTVPVTGPLTDTELRASPVPVTIPTPVPVTQSTTPWITDGSGSVQPVSGTVTALQGTTPWTISGSVVTSPDVNIHDSAGNALSSTGTSLNVDVTNTVPISGTVTANQGTSPWVVSGTVTANLGTIDGAATEATLATRLADATFTSRINTLGQKTMANSTPIVIASDQSAITVNQGVVTTSTITRVTSNSAASQQLLASNSSRKMMMFYNDSTGVQYIKFGTTASATDFTVRMTSQSYYEAPLPIYPGRVDVISGNNNGAIQTTELT